MDLFEYLKKILFLDLETVAECESFDGLNQQKQKLWHDQVKQSYTERDWFAKSEISKDDLKTLYRNRAAIHAEFGKIICIGMGYLTFDKAIPTLRVRVSKADSADPASEKEVLRGFMDIASKFEIFCAHNGKKFDYPYLARRMLINGIVVPPILDTRNKKPWEINHIDTQEMWRFGDMVYPSLELLANCLDIPFSKGIEGNQIHDVYYSGDINRITDYCAEDVVTLCKVYNKLQDPSRVIEKIMRV